MTDPSVLADPFYSTIKIFLLSWVKDSLKAFDDFKNKEKSVWSNFVLMCQSMYIMKVNSVHCILR